MCVSQFMLAFILEMNGIHRNRAGDENSSSHINVSFQMIEQCLCNMFTGQTVLKSLYFVDEAECWLPIGCSSLTSSLDEGVSCPWQLR